MFFAIKDWLTDTMSKRRCRIEGHKFVLQTNAAGDCNWAVCKRCMEYGNHDDIASLIGNTEVATLKGHVKSSRAALGKAV